MISETSTPASTTSPSRADTASSSALSVSSIKYEPRMAWDDLSKLDKELATSTDRYLWGSHSSERKAALSIPGHTIPPEESMLRALQTFFGATSVIRGFKHGTRLGADPRKVLVSASILADIASDLQTSAEAISRHVAQLTVSEEERNKLRTKMLRPARTENVSAGTKRQIEEDQGGKEEDITPHSKKPARRSTGGLSLG